VYRRVFLEKYARKGGGGMAVSIAKLKKQLMDRVDINDLAQVEKVERYIDLVKVFRKINKIINDEGESVKIENGSQVFIKAHPLCAERSKINSSLIALGKDLGLENPLKSNGSGSGDGYSKSDLV